MNDIDPSGSSNYLQIQLLQSWLQARRNRGSPSEQMLSRGFCIDKYTVESALGAPGGSGAVYKAVGGEGEKAVAVKVFHAGSISALQREVDVLQAITHQNIVRVFDHGTTADGLVYMVMELLNGDTLRSKCTLATKLSQVDARNILRDLLSAISYVHPNMDKVEELRSKNSLTMQEVSELMNAKHGYVHRDIKPENVIIVPMRGPVLIDFSISSKVSSPVKTDSATQGYLPPDYDRATWNEDVDLYQIGLTVLQALHGFNFRPDILQDLRELTAKECKNSLGRVLLKLTEAERGSRYSSARAALADISV